MSNSSTSGKHDRSLVRDIRVWGASFISLNSMIGAGIFALPAAVAVAAGAFSPWLFLLVGVLFISIVLVFAELGSYFDGSGGPAEYTSESFGPFAGFMTGWLLFVSRIVAAAANINVMATYLGKLVPWFASGYGRILFITIFVLGLTWLNVLGVKKGVQTLGVFTLLKVTPLVLMILLGLPYIGMEQVFSVDLPAIDDMDSVALLIIYAYIGFEAASFTAGETRNARKTVPMAMIRTILATALLYFMIMLVFVSVLPDANSQSTLVDVGHVLAGPVGATVIALAAVFSIGGNMASNIMTVPRISFALSEQKLLPRWFSNIHARYLTPDYGLWFMGGLVLAFALSGTFVWLAAASSLARLMAYGLCAASIPVLRKRFAGKALEGYKMPLGPLIPLFAIAMCLWMAWQASEKSWITVSGLAAMGVVFYFLSASRRGQAS